MMSQGKLCFIVDEFERTPPGPMTKVLMVNMQPEMAGSFCRLISQAFEDAKAKANGGIKPQPSQ